MDARSKGAKSSWDSQSRVIYRSSQSHAPDVSDFPSSSLLRVAMAESITSKCLASVFKNLTMTFSPLTLQNVYMSLHVALEVVINSWDCGGGLGGGFDVRQARNAFARTGTRVCR